ncbi:MAG: hypothetical protein M0R48_08685 [Candidatus Omnitrophica bacterium]|nr:hypothetical protein [Candidatus Omnitrophota bacterium]
MPAHLYVSGNGIAMSKSPKKALTEARRLAEANRSEDCVQQGLPKGIGLIPVWDETILFKDEKIVMVKL